jgi:large subunit ribosomal protein L32
MAVPKKRTSKSKKNSRKATWKKKAEQQAGLAFTRISRLLSTGKNKTPDQLSEVKGFGRTKTLNQ